VFPALSGNCDSGYGMIAMVVQRRLTDEHESVTGVQTVAVRVGRFDCGPSDRRWRETNWIGPRPHVVLPGTPVWISRQQAGEQAADRSRVLLYDAHQEYRRRLLDPRGDHCVYVELDPAFLSAVTGGPATGIGALSVPNRTSASAVLHRLASSPAAHPDPEAAEEQVFIALVDLLSPLSRGDARPTQVPRAELVRSILATDLARPLRLSDVAAAVRLSPYHLLRWFKAVTGATPIAYRARLRVLAAVEVILHERDAPLNELAAELGFASHSHLSAVVRRETGRSPSALRRTGSLSDLGLGPAAGTA
jgi:AraC-like DNA-binding protein